MRKRSLVPILYIAFLLLPIYWLVAMSFKTTGEILSGFSLFPQTFTLENYRVIFTDRSSTDATLAVVASSGAGADDLIISFANGDQVTFINALSTNNDTQVSFVDFLGDGVSLST